MAGPTRILEFAPTSGPLDAAPSWQDITSYLISGQTKRGRQHELGVVQAGTMSLVLDNRDGTFNPWNTSGPFYNGGAGIRPLRPIRLRAVYGGVTYAVWRGYIQKLTPRWGDAVNSEMDVECADAFMVFNLASQYSRAYYNQVIADAATSYWRCGEPAGATSFGDAAGTNRAAVNGSPSLGVAGAILLDPDGAFSSATGNDYGQVTSPNTVGPSGAGAFSLEAWVRRDATGPTAFLFSNYDPDNIRSWQLSLDGGGVISFRHARSGSTFTITSTSSVPVDGAFHHVVCARAADGFTYTLYLDGGVVGTAADGSSAVTISSGGATSLGGGQVGAGQPGSFDELAIYKTSALSAAQVLDHYIKGRPAQAGVQTSGARVGAVLDALGWPPGDRALDQGLSNCQAESSQQAGTSALSYMQLVESTEMGALFMSADGKVTFHQRDKLYKAPYNQSQLTLGPGGEAYELDQTTPAGDDTGVYNDISASRIGGVVQYARDGASISSFGQRSLSETGLLNTNDNEVLDRVNYRLANFKNYAARVERVHVHPMDDPSVLYPQVFTRDLRDQVLFGRDFIGQGTALSQPSRIEGVEHVFGSDGDWHTYWALTPAEQTTYWLLDTSVLDTQTRLAA